ncbi:hypothetical protein [uncultured Thiodictyon sp.]|uniref:hypothetical protein n=1 Tax=uncultured Thiodictyon sp. TaxID=1846217 RepID=UPI0025F7AC8B|nr:hypothetical protein [uncultured Thiodictyon sp.]
MTPINVNDVAHQMLVAAQGVLKDKWPEVQNFATSEAKKFAQSMADIQVWKGLHQITEEQAQSLTRLHQRSMKMVFTSLEGISLAMAEKAINAALDVVRAVVNKAIGWKVI